MLQGPHVSRQVLRGQVLRAHSQYLPAVKKLGLVCPGCGKYIMGDWDPHEWLVKRSAVPKDRQHLIFVPENVIPVHHHCHNNSKELTRKCLAALVPNVFPAAQIGKWYKSLWDRNGLSVPRGALIPPKDLPVSMRLRMFSRGLKILQINTAGWQTHDGNDIRGIIGARWAGKTRNIPKPPKEWQGILVARLYEAMDIGYWIDYLEGVVG